MKRDLLFERPILNAAGTLGSAPDGRAPVAWKDIGAFITNPVSLRPRLPTSRPAVLEFPGGLLLHTGLPNPGLSAILDKHAARWKSADLPIIPHVMADRPEETGRMIRMLEGIENVMAVELGFAPMLADDILYLSVEMCQGEVPLIVSLPAEQVLRAGARCLDKGAAAISLAPPRGALQAGSGRGLVEGRLYGPSLFPQSLELVHTAAKLGLPIIGAGGVLQREQIEAMLEAGALAVQLDLSLWLPKN
jgi:dihydroorotate dehydrogenase (NAD+) catalytic subunit